MALKIISAVWLACALSLTGCGPPVSIPQGVQVYFSPRGGATEAVVNALNLATNAVLVQAYSFTSAPIARALVEAQRRGVKVQVILDKSQRTEKYSEADFLTHQGVPTLIDADHAIAHNKIIVIDGYVVLTGSFNFTRAAEENNAENLLLINDPVLARQYIDNWHAHERHAQPFERASNPEPRTARARRA
jgi:phosphatidylserine/phosphatidylglycerophosphate/cardiolipin synthase-like enzyme